MKAEAKEEIVSNRVQSCIIVVFFAQTAVQRMQLRGASSTSDGRLNRLQSWSIVHNRGILGANRAGGCESGKNPCAGGIRAIISFCIPAFQGMLGAWDNAVRRANAPCNFFFSTTSIHPTSWTRRWINFGIPARPGHRRGKGLRHLGPEDRPAARHRRGTGHPPVCRPAHPRRGRTSRRTGPAHHPIRPELGPQTHGRGGPQHPPPGHL